MRRGVGSDDLLILGQIWFVLDFDEISRTSQWWKGWLLQHSSLLTKWSPVGSCSIFGSRKWQRSDQIYWSFYDLIRPYSEELDSYLYQTVGQDAIEFVAEALDVPLYRRIISGASIEQGSEYGARTSTESGVAGDETEDLYSLLLEIKVRLTIDIAASC